MRRLNDIIRGQDLLVFLLSHPQHLGLSLSHGSLMIIRWLQLLQTACPPIKICNKDSLYSLGTLWSDANGPRGSFASLPLDRSWVPCPFWQSLGKDIGLCLIYTQRFLYWEVFTLQTAKHQCPWGAELHWYWTETGCGEQAWEGALSGQEGATGVCHGRRGSVDPNPPQMQLCLKYVISPFPVCTLPFSRDFEEGVFNKVQVEWNEIEPFQKHNNDADLYVQNCYCLEPRPNSTSMFFMYVCFCYWILCSIGSCFMKIAFMKDQDTKDGKLDLWRCLKEQGLFRLKNKKAAVIYQHRLH